VGLDLGKGEHTAVQKEQPQVEQKTPARQRCQALGKGEPDRITQCDSNKCGMATNLSIQSPSGNRLYLLRKRGRRLGWPTWPKIRFKSHAQNRWKSRFRTLSRRSIRFKPTTCSCKLSRCVPIQSVESMPCHTIQNALSAQAHSTQKATAVASPHKNGA